MSLATYVQGQMLWWLLSEKESPHHSIPPEFSLVFDYIAGYENRCTNSSGFEDGVCRVKNVGITVVKRDCYSPFRHIAFAQRFSRIY